MEAVLNMWTTKEPLRRDATATVNALTLITLSLKHGPTRGGNNLLCVTLALTLARTRAFTVILILPFLWSSSTTGL